MRRHLVQNVGLNILSDHIWFTIFWTLPYLVKAELEVDQQAIEKEREKLGRFILATNDPDLTGDEILSHYKSQSKIERGFRFLKDKSFHVSEVYLKKESRIEALTMIMVLCLFFYSIAQWVLRKN